MGPNLQTKTATFHEGGNKLVCTTSTEDIGEAVAKSLQHPEETRNKPVYVYSAAVTEKQVTDLVSKITGIKFEVQHADVRKDADEALAILKRGEKIKWSKMVSLYFLMMYGEGYGGDYRDIAMNETIGLRVMDEKIMEEEVRKWIAAAQSQSH